MCPVMINSDCFSLLTQVPPRVTWNKDTFKTTSFTYLFPPLFAFELGGVYYTILCLKRTAFPGAFKAAAAISVTRTPMIFPFRWTIFFPFSSIFEGRLCHGSSLYDKVLIHRCPQVAAPLSPLQCLPAHIRMVIFLCFFASIFSFL